MHGSRLSAGKAVCALPVPGRLHLCQPAESAGDPGTEELGQYQTRIDYAPEYLLEGRRARRLPESVLEIRLVAAAAWRHRRADFLGVGRASFDHVRARRFGRSAERIELFDAAARSIHPCRVTTHENAGAVVPFAEGSAGPHAGARRAWPGGRRHADQGLARIYAGPRAGARCSSRRLRRARDDPWPQRPWSCGIRRVQSGARPEGLSPAPRSRTDARSGLAAAAGAPRWKFVTACDHYR